MSRALHTGGGKQDQELQCSQWSMVPPNPIHLPALLVTLIANPVWCGGEWCGTSAQILGLPHTTTRTGEWVCLT